MVFGGVEDTMVETARLISIVTENTKMRPKAEYLMIEVAGLRLVPHNPGNCHYRDLARITLIDKKGPWELARIQSSLISGGEEGEEIE